MSEPQSGSRRLQKEMGLSHRDLSCPQPSFRLIAVLRTSQLDMAAPTREHYCRNCQSSRPVCKLGRESHAIPWPHLLACQRRDECVAIECGRFIQTSSANSAPADVSYRFFQLITYLLIGSWSISRIRLCYAKWIQVLADDHNKLHDPLVMYYMLEKSIAP
jgi:hypothetical protein